MSRYRWVVSSSFFKQQITATKSRKWHRQGHQVRSLLYNWSINYHSQQTVIQATECNLIAGVWWSDFMFRALLGVPALSVLHIRRERIIRTNKALFEEEGSRQFKGRFFFIFYFHDVLLLLAGQLESTRKYGGGDLGGHAAKSLDWSETSNSCNNGTRATGANGETN